MPVIIGMLWGAFYSMIASIIGRVLFSLGMGYFVFSGFDIMFNTIKNQIVANFSGAGPIILGVLYTAKVDVCISIIFSAFLIKATLAGMNKANGTITSLKVKS